MVPPPKAVTNATTMQPIKSISLVPAEMHPEMALANVPRKSAAVVIGESMALSDMVGMRPPRSCSSGSGCSTTMLSRLCGVPQAATLAATKRSSLKLADRHKSN